MIVRIACILGDNIEVVPTNQQEKYTLIENMFSGHSFTGVDTVPAGSFGPVFNPTHETVKIFFQKDSELLYLYRIALDVSRDNTK